VSWGSDFIPDSLEDKAEGLAEDVGGLVDKGTDVVADGMDTVGVPSGAGNWVRDTGDGAASALGATPGEAQLGETDDYKKLIHGSASTLRANAAHLKDFQKAFEKIARGLKGLDAQHLRGKAADAFREKVQIQPKKWHTAADACEKAAKALEDFAGTVSWAQGQAKEALAKYNRGKTASETHSGKVEAYNDAVEDGATGDDLPDKPAETDPGAAGIREAQQILNEARRQRDEAARTATTAVDAAQAAAPAKPSYATQLAYGAQAMQLNYLQVSGGLVKGTAGLVNFARGLNPYDPYVMTHPSEYVMNLNSTTTGLIRMSNDPVGTGKTMWDEFKKNPGEFGGRLIPEIVGSKGAGIARKGMGMARRTPGAGRADVGEHPHDKSRDPDCRKCDGDPVDIATGHVLLPETDVSLPGTLPLVFRRSFNSSYRAGRWFGPTWSSTIDQRLEIDAEGVVFHGEDNLLLAYPHPAPGLPTMPENGARWPLESTVDGDYVLTDPATGRQWHFTGPYDGGDGTALLEQISDRNGNRLTFEYGPDGTPIGVIHSGGYYLKFTTEHGRVTALHLAGAASDGSDQEIKRYAYTDGHLTEVTNSSGLPMCCGCDEQGRMTSWTDTNGRSFQYVYDEKHRCISQAADNGFMQLSFNYSGTDERTGHKITTVTDTYGHTRRYAINDRLQVIAETDALGNTKRSEWDRYNRLISETDALSRTTTYRYGDDVGPLQAVTRPDGRMVEVESNDLQLPTAVTDADGSRLNHEYDDRGNRTALIDPAGNVTRYAYDERGHLLAMTDALGAVIHVRCNAAGLPVEITEPGGAVTRYERDAFGRPIATVDPLGATTRLTWTVEGQLACRFSPDGAREAWTYDGDGNCTAQVDAGGGVTASEYTHFDLLTGQTGPDGVRHEFTYDAELRLIQVTNPQGLTWDYTYDPAGRLIAESDFDDRTVTYEVDPAGQLASKTNPLGQRITFERDPLGQITRKDLDGQVTTFAYDPAGRLTQASGPDAEVVVQRDKLGRVKTEMTAGRALAHTYDALGRRTRRVTPTGAISTFTYDTTGNRATLTTSGHTLDFTHDEAGRETHRRIGNTAEFVNSWDPAGRLTAQTVTATSSPAPVQQRSYTYRLDGHLAGMDDQLNGPRVFDLDTAGRVTAVRAENWSETYAYDEAGNQTAANWPAQHASTDARGQRTYAGTRLLSAGTIRYEHDAAGRIILRQKTRLSKKPDTWRYTWNAEDQLTSVITPDGTTWRYLYDPFGRRIAKQRLADDGETVTEQVDFTWDGPTLIEQTTTAHELPNPVTLTWDHDGLRPLTQTERITDATSQREIDSRFFAIVTDLVGTPTELLDEQGDIAWRTRTTLWGTTTWNADATTYTPLRFPGQYHDPETALHYNFHRHYDPTTARYLSPDPLGLAPDPNPHTYVENPFGWIDPLGLSCIPYGPATEKVQNVLDRVRDKGSPPAGYKGGRMFENTGAHGAQRLPDTDPAGNPIAYREWDVNPKVKGVDRGEERLVTGSDGSAYYTTDHYLSFIQVP
jgi:RHS repeat-associated protein